MPRVAETARSIFMTAVERYAPDQWAAYLDDACDDSDVRKRVEELLQAHVQMGSIHGSEQLPTFADSSATSIGPYKLREQIGEGGFGVVYVAEQTKPIRRKVALKIIKPGMDSKEIIARFEAERQALALMDHPNIAKVLDAGTTMRDAECGMREEATAFRIPNSALAASRPYFVMELVRGVPITEFCDKEKLTTQERLRLFTDVCRAVQHAHQKGVIHRDIKPTNVLVTLHDGKPVPKVIDFGVAKALSQQLTEHTLYTALGQMVGTPMYMSPEQAEMSGLDVDTRSDVYSLGVLLYELLTGSTPFDRKTFKEAGLEGMRRIIRETEPVKPSARISTLKDDHGATISDNRRVDRKRLEQALRGDLDWVVMKALEKDRNRRYETPSAFAADVEHYLNDEPVAASPPSALYRLRKYARRNRQGVITGAVLALICLVVVGAVGWVVRDRAAQRAVLRIQVMAALNDVELLLAEGRPRAALTAAERARDMVAQSEADAALIAAVRQGNADIQMVLRLEEIRLSENNEFFDRRAIAQYEAAFEKYGVPLIPADPERIAAAIRSRPQSVRQALLSGLNEYGHHLYMQGELGFDVDDQLRITGILPDSPAADSTLRPGDRVRGMGSSLDDIVDTDSMSSSEFHRKWHEDTGALVVLRVTSAEDPEPRIVSFTRSTQWRQVLAVLRAADDDPWRQQFWDALENHDGEALHRLMRSEQLLLQPPASIAMVARYRVGSISNVEVLRDAQTRYPGDFFINYWLTLEFLQQDPPEWRQALPFAEAAVALRPDSVRAHDLLGVVRSWNQDLRGAIMQFRRAVELDPEDAHAHFSLGSSLRRQNQLDEAVVELRRAIELNTDHASVHTQLADILKATGDLEGAIDAYRQAARLQPWEAARHLELAEALELNGDREGAVVAWANALKEGLERDRESVLWTLMTDDEAFFAEVTRLLPDDPRPWEARGRAYARLEQWDRAAADHAEALRLINRQDNWWGDGGRLAMRIAQMPEVFRRVLALRPYDDRLSVAIAREYAANDQFEFATDELTGVVDRNPNDFWASYVRAHLQCAVDDVEGYQGSCDAMLTRIGNDNYSRIRSSRACLLTRNVTQERLNEIQLIVDATDPPSGWERLYDIAAGLLAFRKGDLAATRKQLELRSSGLIERESICDLLLAMVEYQDGSRERSRELYETAVAAMEEERDAGDHFRRRMEIDQWLAYEILRREAAELMQIEERVDTLRTRLRPDDWRAWEASGRAFALEKEWDRAAADYWQALQLVDDTDPNAWFGADVELALRAAEWPAVFDSMLRSYPDAIVLRIVQVRRWASSGNVALAAEAMEHLAQETMTDHWNWVVSATLNLRAGNHSAYRRACDELLSRWSRHGFKPVQMVTARECLLSSQMEDRLEEVQAIVDDARAALCPDGWESQYDVIGGLMAYRSGDLQQARELLTKQTAGSTANHMMAQFILAMVEQRDGNLELAHETYAAAVATLERKSPESNVSGHREYIHYWSMVDILRREAAELLQIDERADELRTRLMRDDPRAWEDRARAFVLSEQWDHAAAEYWEALQLTNDHSSAWWGTDVDIALRAAESPEVFEAMLRSHPDAVVLRIVQARLWASTGEVARAAEAMTQLAEETKSDHWILAVSAALHLHAGNHAPYRRACDELLARWSHCDYTPEQMITVHACLLSTLMEDRYEEVQAIVDDTLESPCPGEWRWRYDLITGLMAFRSGDLEQARGLLIKHIDGTWVDQIMARFILAMVEHRDGNLERAREIYADTAAAFERESPESNVIMYRTHLHSWSMVDILRREAAELLQMDDTSDTAEADSPVKAATENNTE